MVREFYLIKKGVNTMSFGVYKFNIILKVI